MSLRIRAGAASHVGQVRSINQDAYLVLPEQQLFVVADGMGGHQGGEVASRLAIDTIRGAYVDVSTDGLAEAITEANLKIHDSGEADSSLRGMGTTVVAAAVIADDRPDDPTAEQLVIASVGDSRAYLFRDGALTQLTEDHSIVGDLLREGRITEEEAEVHPQRNIVTRVLGVYPEVEIDIWPVDAVRGDRFVLCSDGLFNEVRAEQIAAVLRRLAEPQDAASELVRLANEGGGRDNITVAVLDVVDDGGIAEHASAALADEPGRRGSETDLAGFSTARGDEPGPVVGASEPKDEPEVREPKARRGRPAFTWRTLAFLVLVIAVIGGAVATIQWYGTSTYYVGFDGDEVAIFQGRPGGLLWIDPELEDDTGIRRDEVPERYLDALESGSEQASLTQARVYVSNIERDIIEEARTTTTTTSTVPVDPNAVTTTAPAVN
ncbi:MAG: Stp1/IreP family PP2C-type Ser/Thr phosphatase [Actinomycetota bacterium]|nr:Stp1/IreP family PP2C-type Ser/Thr phosphatase [Actinomycetota bacterium]